MQWIETTLGEICKIGGGEIKTGPFGSQLHQYDYEEVGTPVVMPKDIIDGCILEDSIARVNNSHKERLSQHQLAVGDIVYGRRGDIGRQALVREYNKGWLCGTGCLRVTLGDKSPLSSRFLHLYLKQPDVVSWISNQAIGATMPNLNTSILKSVPVKFPESYQYQEEISDIIFSYENLIENNNNRIAILEEMAQSLYREWFVNFRFPGHENCKFVDSPMGKVPEGWSVKSLGEVADINNDQINAKNAPDYINYIDISSVSPGSIDSITKYSFNEAPGRARRIVRHGDVLWSCVRPNRRSFALVINPEENTVASTGFAVISAKVTLFSYLYFAISTDKFVSYLANNATGSAYPAVTAKDFEQAEILLPKSSILELFDSLVLPALSQSHTLRLKNSILKEQRNMLLPRLVSGSIKLAKE